MANRKLGRTADKRRAMLRALVTDLIIYGRIETTEMRAKEVQRIADRMVTLGKRQDLHARRQAVAYLLNKTAGVKVETREIKQYEKYRDEEGRKRTRRNGVIEKEVKLDELVPSDTPYVYNFKVANNDGKNRLETKLEYTLKIVTTTNLPLSYKLYMNENYNYNASTNIITKDTIEKTGEDGAYFRTLETAKQTFGFDKDEENIYHLVVTFPKEYDSFEYQDIIEGVTICIESKQIIDKNA